MGKPEISVIISTCNRAEKLKRAVVSAIKQDFPGIIEVCVVGDGCRDDSDRIMRSFTSNGKRIVRWKNLKKNHGKRLYRKGDCGVTPKNTALKMSSADLIAYLDDDNYWEKEHVSTLYQLMHTNGSHDFVFSATKVMWEHGPGIRNWKEKPKFGKIDTGEIMHKRNLLEKYGYWNPKAMYKDWDIVERWLRGGCRWAHSEKPTHVYFPHPRYKPGEWR